MSWLPDHANVKVPVEKLQVTPQRANCDKCNRPGPFEGHWCPDCKAELDKSAQRMIRLLKDTMRRMK